MTQEQLITSPARYSTQANPRARVAYLGPMGTYSYEITRQRFSNLKYELVPHETIRDTIYALVPGKDETRASWAVVPIENSSFGPVLETHQTLSEPKVIRYTRTLDQRMTLKVQHCLVGRKSCNPLSPTTGERSIQRILSHLQALGQCQTYIALHYPDAEKVATASTAEAAELVANDLSQTSLAICSASCIEYFPDLEILASNIQDAGKENVTTFIILESKD